ncbi:hypothetical protein BGZ60DRAFT_531924 [Tricladium varicosporioides]|nr:hypothetical protein BGZ60DRAFT_531924 [Hymenoscyphus varicosporioides]
MDQPSSSIDRAPQASLGTLTEKELYHCPFCPYKIVNRQLFLRHLNETTRHNALKTIPCFFQTTDGHTCKEHFYTTYLRDQHLQFNHKDACVRCKLCTGFYASKNQIKQLETHVNTAHKGVVSLSYFGYSDGEDITQEMTQKVVFRQAVIEPQKPKEKPPPKKRGRPRLVTPPPPGRSPEKKQKYVLVPVRPYVSPYAIPHDDAALPPSPPLQSILALTGDVEELSLSIPDNSIQQLSAPASTNVASTTTEVVIGSISVPSMFSTKACSNAAPVIAEKKGVSLAVATYLQRYEERMALEDKEHEEMVTKRWEYPDFD